MELIEKLNKILENELTSKLIPDILTIQNEFLKIKDYNNYYLCTNKIIDIYINEENLDEALDLALDLYSKSNLSSFRESYKQVIDQLIYIYITKQYYQRALSLLNKKKELIDINNNDEVNRLYLELSYIHEALGEKSASLGKLKAILENNPSLETKTVVLSNITKLYIDNNNFDEAKKTLQESIELVDQINDVEGKRYCKYLKGLIAHLEGNFKEAKKYLYDLYKNIKPNDNLRENITYINEYFNLILDMNDYKEAIEITEKYLEVVLKCDDSFNKLIFLKNILRLGVMSPNALKKVYKGKYDTETILKMVNNLEAENSANNTLKSTEIKEDELSFQMTNSENTLYSRLLQNLNDVIVDYADGNIRSLLINYSSSLRNKVMFDEVLYVILNKENNMIVPNIETTFDRVYTYQFKNERLYERELNFDVLIQTPIEKLLTQTNDINIILDSEVNMLDPITLKPYSDNYKYMHAISLKKNNKVYGACIYLSKGVNLQNPFSNVLINLSSKMLSYALISLFNQNCNLLQYNLLNVCDSKSPTGIFYYSVKDMQYILSEKCQKILNIDRPKISKEEYVKLISKSDLKEYLKQKELLEKQEEYEVKYHLNIKDKNILVSEVASPFITNSGEQYYCGRISLLEFDETFLHEIKQFHPLSFKEFSLYLDTLKDKSFKVLAINSRKDIFTELYNLFNDNIYFINNIYYYIFIDKNVKNITSKLEKAHLKDISYTIIEYPDKLVRIDDLLGLTSYMLTKEGYVDFGNEIYACYISKSTICECLERALITDNVIINYKDLFVGEDKVGLYAYPTIKGIYNNDSLKVIDDNEIYDLYKYLVNNIKESNDIYLLKIRNISLLNLLKENKIQMKSVIFDLNGSDYANEILKHISNKNYKLIVTNEFMKNISIESIINYSNSIVGFSDEIDDSIIKLFETYNNKYYFYGDKGFRIE